MSDVWDPVVKHWRAEPTFVHSVRDLVKFTTVALLGDGLGGIHVGEGGH